jgi:hypothetical protein
MRFKGVLTAVELQRQFLIVNHNSRKPGIYPVGHHDIRGNKRISFLVAAVDLEATIWYGTGHHRYERIKILWIKPYQLSNRMQLPAA